MSEKMREAKHTALSAVKLAREISDQQKERPTAAPTADDAERAQDFLNYEGIAHQTDLLAPLAAAFASIRASQAADLAALKGELLAARKPFADLLSCLAPGGYFPAAGKARTDAAVSALTSTADRAAAIERAIRAQARADMLLEMDTVVAENYPRPVNPIEEMRRRDPTLPRAANAMGETNG